MLRKQIVFLFFLIIFDMFAMRLHVFNVGHGCFSICTNTFTNANGEEEKRALILDCGGSILCDQTKQKAFKLLNKADKINVIVSHADYDHYNFLPTFFDDSTDGKAMYKKLENIYIGYSKMQGWEPDGVLKNILENAKTVSLENKIDGLTGMGDSLRGCLGSRAKASDNLFKI